MLEDINNMPSTFNQSLFEYYMDSPEINQNLIIP